MVGPSGWHSLRVAEVRPEAGGAVCVAFHVPCGLREAFRFIQGQYLTLGAEIGGEEVSRSYSICSGVDDGCLKVGIKRIEGGAFSTYANERLRAGDEIRALPPQGNFFTPLSADHDKRYLCICIGSGITPILSIVKTVLKREPRSRVTLLYGNRNSATVMFKSELGFVKNRYLARFNWINILSREEQDAEVLHGRLDNRKGAELQRKRLIDIAATDEFFLCGPQSMISEVSRGLRGAGVDEARIHYELFSSSAEDARAAVEKHLARARQHAGRVSDVTVTAAGRSARFELSSDGESILDGALRNGADLPFSCKGGVCATCRARLLEGQVELDINHALSAQELAEGLILTCQAHPVSDRVAVDFDQL
ncbi:MAG: phenylacetate-CoA oxygenase/reductase subunit PaaK [Gammaproteobacteria bacterium]|nr:phenylacetate-CoA oxygenase/reductase subunit PaaK [Gammaproteobacteria bacterium]MCY4341129.1 phenylacetate-CoA oxygenase/reductase subunit PaaK [Gammaproteobacteria bacterium]